MTVRFIHVTTLGRGNVTLALSLVGAGSELWEVGAAFCSPTERNFSRKLGRQIAQGRLESKRHGYTTFSRAEGSPPLSLKERPLEIIDILRRLSAKEYGQQSTPGPKWWPLFMVGVRREYDHHQARLCK